MEINLSSTRIIKTDSKSNGLIGDRKTRLPGDGTAPEPEIDLVGNGVNIVNGDPTPTPADQTDFGTACASVGEIIHTFTINNTGDDVLTLLNAPSHVLISGVDAPSFSLQVLPATTVAINGNTSFQVRFAPLTPGVKNATLTIQNNDADENPFSFSIQGTGVGAPTISAQPTTQTATSPTGVSFNVAATNAVGFQWQVNGGTVWANIPTGYPYSGTTSTTLIIEPALEELDGNAYRCILNSTSPCTNLASEPAGLIVYPGTCVNDAAVYNSWTFSGATVAPNQGCSGSGILFNAAGEYAVTPLVTNPRFLNFSQKRSTNTSAWGMKLQVGSSNSGPWTDVWSTTSISATCTPAATIDLSAFTGARYIRFLDARLGAGAEERGIDDISISCGISCTPVHSISSFMPTTAPPSALITIRGTNFSGTAAVRFGLVPANSFTVKNDTTIIAEVPSNAASDQVIIVKDGCEVRSVNFFTPMATLGSCGTNGSPSVVNDLFISEVYDAEAGCEYIELFNGTPSPIVLGAPNNYVLQVKTGISTNFTLAGTIASGATYLGKLGTANSCSVTPQFQDNSSVGFNGNDEIFLLKNGATGSIIDYVPNPNFGGQRQPGFTQRRKATTTAASLPAPTFTPADWLISLAEDCSHLAIPPYVVSTASNIVISTQPQDVNCNLINFTVAVTGSGPGVNAVLWKYNDPATMNGWSNVGNLNGTLGLTTTGTNTSSMTISGNTAQLLNYQFYAEVQRGSCINATQAVQYTYDTKAVYRSNVAAGNWSNPSSWLMADNASGPFILTCAFPTAVNSKEVIIRANDHIILPMDVDVHALTIENSGTLEIATAGKLKVGNGLSGADLTVNGILLDRGSAGNGVQFATGASWLLGSTIGKIGTIIKTNTSSVTGYRDNYSGGISSMATTPSWYYRYNGDGNPNVAAVDMFYPNLFFENTANTGTFSWNTAFMALDGSSSNTVVQGNLNIGTTGIGKVAVYNNNIYSSPLLVKGNLDIAAGSLLTNQSYNNISDAAHGAGTGIEVQGNLTVNGTLTLNVKDSGLLKLSGSANQNISGTGVTNLQDVMLANNGGLVSLNKPLAIPGVFTLGPNSRLELQAGNLTLRSTSSQTARVAPVGAGTIITYPGPGRFVVERFFKPRRAWRLITAPITAEAGRSIFNSWQKAGQAATGEGMFISAPQAPANGLDLSVQGNYSMFTYAGAGLIGVSDTKNKLISGTGGIPNKPDNFGMFAFVRGDRSSHNLFFPPNVSSTTLRDTGKLQVHDQVFNLVSTTGGYSLLGNPYAAPVDITAVLAGSTNLVKSRFYAYDPYLNSSQGGYITFTNSGPGFVATPPSPGGLSSIIQSSQAFYVEHTAVNATMVFREIDKAPQTTNTVFRPVDQSYSNLRINLLVISQNQPAVLADGVLVEYSEAGDNKVNEADAIKFPNSRENLAILRQGRILTVENRGTLNDEDTVFLHLKNLANAQYQFEFSAQEFDRLLIATLEDRYTGLKTPLNLSTKLSIDFTITADTASFSANRFCVIFHRVVAALPVNFISLTAVAQGRDVQVKWKVASESGILHYIVERSENGSGFQPVATITPTASQGLSSIYQWIDDDPIPGNYCYRVRSIDRGGEAQLSSVAYVSINRTPGEITLLANPVSNGEITIQFNNMVAGNYALSLYDQLGRLSGTKSINHNSPDRKEKFSPLFPVANGLYRLRVFHPGGQVSWLDVIFKE
ncbi:MAG: choice-of-anchor D domain-containing protein [Bacteroidota bacterium]